MQMSLLRDGYICTKHASFTIGPYNLYSVTEIDRRWCWNLSVGHQHEGCKSWWSWHMIVKWFQLSLHNVYRRLQKSQQSCLIFEMRLHSCWYTNNSELKIYLKSLTAHDQVVQGKSDFQKISAKHKSMQTRVNQVANCPGFANHILMFVRIADNDTCRLLLQWQICVKLSHS